MKKCLIAVSAALALHAMAVEKPFVWENLTVDDFVDAVRASKGVVVVPIGCIEMHNHHLPLGTDYFVANDIVRKAAEQEAFVYFSLGMYGAVRESQNQPGTVSLSSNTLRAMLEDLCDEFARNGLNDIVFWNDHGGNTMFLEEFVRSRLDRPHPYRVYYRNDGYNGPQYKELYAKFGEPKGPWGHAAIMETSSMLWLHPELVFMSRAHVEDAMPLTRLQKFRKLRTQTSFDWFGEAPNQSYGDPTQATKERGEWMFNTSVSNLVELVRAIKADETLPKLQKEFYGYLQNPYSSPSLGKKPEASAR